MKKRFLSALLVLGMVLTLLPTWALAATPDTPLPAPLNDARAGRRQSTSMTRALIPSRPKPGKTAL